jgi:hypothetical protein
MRTPKVLFLCVLLATTLCGHARAWATAEWQVIQTLRLTAKPLDVAIAPTQRWIYVLNEQGQVAIYTADGQLKDTFEVGADVDRITPGAREDLLFLLNRNDNTVRMIKVDIVEEIAVQGAPAKGPAAAPVRLIVFSDFQ